MIATWGRAEHVDMTAVLQTLGAFMPPQPPGTPGPFALSQDGALANLVRQAGLQPRYGDNVISQWNLPDLETALRALMSAGPVTAAIERAGEEQVRAAVAETIEPFRTSSGGYQLENEFIYLIARG
jgi:hypothetical protein